MKSKSMLTIIGKDEKDTSKVVTLCECGTIKSINKYKVITGHTKSCGCLLKTKKGLSHSPEASTWRGMIRRCTDENDKRYYDYGGRGITVCKRWLDFFNFYDDMAPRPSINHQIDRIDNSKGYSPDNCRWVTRKENQRNMRTSVYYEYKGEKKTIPEWSEIYGIKPCTLYTRLNRGKWNIEKALKTPLVKNTSKYWRKVRETNKAKRGEK